MDRMLAIAAIQMKKKRQQARLLLPTIRAHRARNVRRSIQKRVQKAFLLTIEHTNMHD